MKKYTLRFRQVNKNTFENIKKGKKKVETRAATVKYRNMAKGDVVICVCGKQRFKRKVKKVNIFKSINALLKKYKVEDIEPNFSSVEELQKVYYSYPNYKEKIKKFGLVALELE